MSDELKPCPFCGGNAHSFSGVTIGCGNRRCPMADDQETWNTRPIEDNLRDVVRELVEVLARNGLAFGSTIDRAQEVLGDE